MKLSTNLFNQHAYPRAFLCMWVGTKHKQFMTIDTYVDVAVNSAKGKWKHLLYQRIVESGLPVVRINGIFGKTEVWMHHMELVPIGFNKKFRSSELNGWTWPNNKEFDKVFEEFANAYPNAAYVVEESIRFAGPTIYLPKQNTQPYKQIVDNMPSVKEILDTDMKWMDILNDKKQCK